MKCLMMRVYGRTSTQSPFDVGLLYGYNKCIVFSAELFSGNEQDFEKIVEFTKKLSLPTSILSKALFYDSEKHCTCAYTADKNLILHRFKKLNEQEYQIVSKEIRHAAHCIGFTVLDKYSD